MQRATAAATQPEPDTSLPSDCTRSHNGNHKRKAPAADCAPAQLAITSVAAGPSKEAGSQQHTAKQVANHSGVARAAVAAGGSAPKRRRTDKAAASGSKLPGLSPPEAPAPPAVSLAVAAAAGGGQGMLPAAVCAIKQEAPEVTAAGLPSTAAASTSKGVAAASASAAASPAGAVAKPGAAARKAPSTAATRDAAAAAAAPRQQLASATATDAGSSRCVIEVEAKDSAATTPGALPAAAAKLVSGPKAPAAAPASLQKQVEARGSKAVPRGASGAGGSGAQPARPPLPLPSGLPMSDDVFDMIKGTLGVMEALELPSLARRNIIRSLRAMDRESRLFTWLPLVDACARQSADDARNILEQLLLP